MKEIDEFYKHNQMADGFLNKCKLCTKADVNKNYRNNREHYVEYEKERWKRPERRKMALEYQRKRRGKNKGKARCRYAVSNALRDGRLKKLLCEICGDENVEAHHPDYRSPLKVKWFCRKHHLEIEGKIPFLKLKFIPVKGR